MSDLGGFFYTQYLQVLSRKLFGRGTISQRPAAHLVVETGNAAP
jgi:hypothetical protein